MAVNKVIYNRNTLIDLTGDTVTEETLFQGYTAHKADGTIITGKMLAGYPDIYHFFDALQDSNGRDITDKLNSAVQGRTVYQKV